ncbi:mandelate racemase/muconate lactonizing enzyme family protein [Variovorax sp. KK3]|uniref:mandelate racemase/muconate lactonizing enzyme family protein n=1 Tax=Variovorax sp. KK3 TaxID=1855728 RepID=UPI00097C64EE|nr:mandelate racemase/muconate lactonizing enzyme family protein [Variovorax sp. KK3]
MNLPARASAVRSATAELWRYRLDKPVGGSGVGAVDLVVVELEDADGHTGTGFGYVLGGGAAPAVVAARAQLERFVVDHAPLHPEALSRAVLRSFNRTGGGAGMIGLAAIDLAAWDLHARRLGVPVGMAMGGADRAVPVYGSGGYHGGQSLESALACAAQHRAQGFQAVKLRVGGGLRDLALIEGVAGRIGRETALMIDANEKCSPTTARRLMAVAREAGVLFVEEPLPANDTAGYAQLMRDGAAVATGEHLQGIAEWGPFLRERLCDVIQPDLAMMGGLSECLRLARMAELFGIEVAPHFLPGVFIHLAAAMPNVSWLEDFPLLEPLFEQQPRYGSNGTLHLPDAPGLGLTWAAGAREAWKLAF